MYYAIFKDPNTGAFSVENDRLSKTPKKAAERAILHFNTHALDNVRICQYYGRTPVWARFGKSYSDLNSNSALTARLDRMYSSGVHPLDALFGQGQGGSISSSKAGSRGKAATLNRMLQQRQQQQQQGGSQQAGGQGQQAPVTPYGQPAQQQQQPQQQQHKCQGLDDETVKRIVSEYLKAHPPVVKVSDPLNLTVTTPKGQKTIQGLTHSRFPAVLSLMATRPRAALLTGPAGCGKTRMAAQVAEALDLPFYTVNMSEGVTEGALFGQRTLEPDGSTGWSDGIVTKAFESGGLLFVDEMDNADPNLMVGLNQILDGSKVVSMAHRVHKPMAKRHSDFLVLCGANTLLNGSAEYSARNAMDGATVDRFMGAIEPIDYCRTLERNLIQDDNALQCLWGFRDFLKRQSVPNLRASTRFGDTLQTRAQGDPEFTLDKMIEQATLLLDNPSMADACARHIRTYNLNG